LYHSALYLKNRIQTSGFIASLPAAAVMAAANPISRNVVTLSIRTQKDAPCVLELKRIVPLGSGAQKNRPPEFPTKSGLIPQ
jgi:hypothetical protein